MGAMKTDTNGQIMQGFAPDPAKSQVPISLAGSKVFKRGVGGDYDITGWSAISITPSVDIVRWFNDDTTKTRTLPGGVESIIILGYLDGGNKLTISGTATVEVEGM